MIGKAIVGLIQVAGFWLKYQCLVAPKKAIEEQHEKISEIQNEIERLRATGREPDAQRADWLRDNRLGQERDHLERLSTVYSEITKGFDGKRDRTEP